MLHKAAATAHRQSAPFLHPWPSLELASDPASGRSFDEAYEPRSAAGGLRHSVPKDHELDRFLLEKQKQESSAKKRKRGSATDSAISSSL